MILSALAGLCLVGTVAACPIVAPIQSYSYCAPAIQVQPYYVQPVQVAPVYVAPVQQYVAPVQVQPYCAPAIQQYAAPVQVQQYAYNQPFAVQSYGYSSYGYSPALRLGIGGYGGYGIRQRVIIQQVRQPVIVRDRVIVRRAGILGRAGVSVRAPGVRVNVGPRVGPVRGIRIH